MAINKLEQNVYCTNSSFICAKFSLRKKKDASHKDVQGHGP